MRSRQTSRQKQCQLKSSIYSGANNYQSARENQNNQKLANLLNLSQVNMSLGESVIKNTNNAAFLSAINTKINQNRKSQVFLENVNNSLYNLNKDQHFQIKKETNKDLNLNIQSSPTKAFRNSKSKKLKSNRKHLLSCQQILNIAKKREVFSAASFEASKSSTMINYGQSKTKKKLKKQKNVLKIQGNTQKAKGLQSGSLDHSKVIQKHEEMGNNFVANYPLSMSNSYIVFSQKDSTMNNTVNILNKVSKKISEKSSEESRQQKIVQLSNKLEKIKIEHAATIIQKHWRGYLTRKLLQDYIKNQESRLLERLTNIKVQQEEFEKFRKLSPGCNKLWGGESLQAQFDDLSGIFENQPQNVLQRTKNETQSQNKISQGLQKSNKLQSQYQSSNQNIKQNFKIIPCFSIQVSQKSSLQKQKISTQNQPLNLQSVSQTFKQNIKTIINERMQQHKKSLAEQVKKSMIQFNVMLKERQKFKQISQIFQQKYNNFIQTIQNLLQLITQPKVKEEKQNLRFLLTDSSKIYQSKLETADALTKRIAIKIKNTQNNENSLGQVASPSCLLVEHPSTQSSNANITITTYFNVDTPTSHVKNCESKHTNSPCSPQLNEQGLEQKKTTVSPISQYFTIELPTEELSPHKKESSTLNSGLESLRTYFYNLNQEYLQQISHQQTQQHSQQPSDGSMKQSQTTFLCKILKKHSEMGPQNMIERCLIQMLVQILTSQHTISDILLTIDWIAAGQEHNAYMLENQSKDNHQQMQQHNNQMEGRQQLVDLINRWAEQLQKWELGPIEEVSCNMEESADVTSRNNTSCKKNSTSGYSHLWLDN